MLATDMSRWVGLGYLFLHLSLLLSGEALVLEVDATDDIGQPGGLCFPEGEVEVD